MSHQRGQSESFKTPHSISLKVLRLSKPTLATQYPLPKPSPEAKYAVDRRAALSCLSSKEDDNFFLSPLLGLPPSFGTVHVGETLLATVCVNNELSPEAEGNPSISKVHLTAEVQIPSQGDGPIPLEVSREDGGAGDGDEVLAAGGTQQHILSFGLQEEGIHVLAITASYAETEQGHDETEDAASRERSRTFRKLYQFTAIQLLSVRTKTRALAFGKNPYVLEAQLENLGDEAIVLESVDMHTRKEFTSKGMNAWDHGMNDTGAPIHMPALRPRNVLQAAFLIEPLTATAEEDSLAADESSRNRDGGRVTLGQMWIRWRGPMGAQGSLNTGWLTGKRA